MGIDTIFPQVFRPSWSILPFEESVLWGNRMSPQEADGYPFHHEHNQWLAKKYPFRTNTLSMTEGYGAMSLAWELGGGCFVHTNNMNPATSEFDDDPRYLYLVLAYREKNKWDGQPLLPRLKEWIRYLELMPSCPIEAIYCRATDCRSPKQKHLWLTNMILDKDASADRLTRCYRRYFRATPWNYTDGDGKPYLKLQFKPQNPKI